MFAYCGNTPVNAADYSGKEMCVCIDRDREGYAVGGGIVTLWLISALIDLFTSDPVPKDKQFEAGANGQSLNDIASKYDLYKCKEAAYEMAAQDNQKGNYIIRLHFKYALNGYVCAPSSIYGYRTAISTNGDHWGYCDRFGFVHCNIYPFGLPEEVWINSFTDAWGSIPKVDRFPLP